MKRRTFLKLIPFIGAGASGAISAPASAATAIEVVEVPYNPRKYFGTWEFVSGDEMRKRFGNGK